MHVFIECENSKWKVTCMCTCMGKNSTIGYEQTLCVSCTDRKNYTCTHTCTWSNEEIDILYYRSKLEILINLKYNCLISLQSQTLFDYYYEHVHT